MRNSGQPNVVTLVCVILSCLLLEIGSVSAEPRIREFRNGYLHPPPKPQGVTLPPDEWFTQKLDHFNPTDNRTWSQRYFTNFDFYQSGGPVFLMIGGEGPADAIWMVEGAWTIYAAETNALLIQLEHRYYGESHPTEDASVENLKYLSSEQALADLATFTVAMKESLGLTDNKWISFGGSYPGSLAAWYRLKYPHLVHGSVATSAPLIAQVDFKEYLEVVRRSLASESSETCNEAIQEAITQMDMLLSRPTGWRLLTSEFQLCSELDGNNKNDVYNMFEFLAENFDGVVQYNKDNRGFEGVKDANITIETICDIMTDETAGDAVNRYAAVNSLILSVHEQSCLEHRYSSMIESLQTTSWDSGAVGGRSWIYQTCTEFGWYQSSGSTEQPFGDKFPLEFFTQMCQDIYGPSFTTELLDDAVARTNAIYGGLGLKVTRVTLPNGSIDPWHAMGTIEDLGSTAPAIFIEGTAHCANMYPPREEDLPQLTQSREQILSLIKTWLSEED